mmetsp:Transcript_513/g.850  ORF Transcript_513/g.850 Transcript_513/m.850 type:complete len:352 (-) Transcript_513:407-1462(-)
MTLFYDPFDADEEDDFLEHERKRGDRETKKFLNRVRSNDSTLKSQSFDYSMTNKQFGDIIETLKHASHLRHLDFLHWGVLVNNEDEFLSLFLATLSTQNCLTHLGLKSCGVTGTGILRIWEFLAGDQNLRSLDLSRNMLGGIRHEENLIFSFTSLSHQFGALEELNLSATGLTSKSISALLRGLGKNSRLKWLDISHNIESLPELLECLLPFIRSTRLRKLVLTKGASSSTCIDAQVKESITLLQQIEEAIKQNSSLCFFGPLFILPVDRHSSSETKQAYRLCVQILQRIQFYLKRNQLGNKISVIGGANGKFCLYPAHHLIETLASCKDDPSSVHYFLREAACLIQQVTK